MRLFPLPPPPRPPLRRRRSTKSRSIPVPKTKRPAPSSPKLRQGRWVVERTFSWLSQNRRMSKDYERLCATGEAFVYAAMTRLMVRRLARAQDFPDSLSTHFVNRFLAQERSDESRVGKEGRFRWWTYH